MSEQKTLKKGENMLEVKNLVVHYETDEAVAADATGENAEAETAETETVSEE